MRSSLFFLCILFSLAATAQSPKASIKFCPLALIDDGTFPTIQAGVEFPLSNKLSWYNELGFRYRKSMYEHSDTSFVSPNGFKFKTEIRYYLGNAETEQMTGYYLAGNLFYNRSRYNNGLGFYRGVDSSKIIADNYSVQKSVFGFNLLAGVQTTSSGHFSLDLYGGFGIRFRHAVASNLEYDKNKDGLSHALDVTVQGLHDDADTKGNSIAANVTVGLRLCWRIQ